MKTTCFLLFVALFLSGCATPFRAPPALAHIKLERIDSPVVLIEKIWLDQKNDSLVVKGYVRRRQGASDTTRTHLDVTFYDQAGRILQTTVGQFKPQQIPGFYGPRIPGRRRMQNYASYSVELNPLPAGTERIEVRASEEVHLPS